MANNNPPALPPAEFNASSKLWLKQTAVCVRFLKPCRHPAQPMSVPILCGHKTTTQRYYCRWFCTVVSGVDNPVPCHRTGYDGIRQARHTHSMKERKIERNKGKQIGAFSSTRFCKQYKRTRTCNYVLIGYEEVHSFQRSVLNRTQANAYVCHSIRRHIVAV